MSTSSKGRNRTIWIWILIIIAFLAGIWALIDAARYMGWLPIASLGPMTFAVRNANWLGAILAAITAAIWFWVANMLYKLDPRGWLFVVIIAILNLVLLGLALIGSTTFQAVSVAVLLNVIALIIAILPSTKAAFGQP